MTGDHWTFLLIRGEGNPVKQVTLSTRRLRALVVGGALATLLLAACVLDLGLTGLDHAYARRLAERNAALVAQLGQFQRRVGSLESRLDGLASRDAEYRTIAGLGEIDPEVMRAGVGGPGLGAFNSYPLWTVDSAASKTAFAVSYDLAALDRRARLLARSLTEATDSLMSHRALLEATPSIEPTVGWISSGFGERTHPLYDRPMLHTGVDFAAPTGTPIYATAAGRVVKAGWDSGYGLTIQVDHGFGYSTVYAHASRILVQVGQEVSRGEVIGKVGSTGLTTAPNLHYEVHVNGVPVNPVDYILPTGMR